MPDTAIGLVPVFNVEHVERSRGAPMTAPPPYTAHPENNEYESLLELHEQQELAAAQTAPATNAKIDLEAARPAPSTPPATAPAPKPLLTIEQLRVMRVKPLDNVRAFALCLLVLQNAAIQAVSMHPDAAQLHQTSPGLLAFVNQFVGVTRLLVVPLLFFVSGVSSGVSSMWAMRFHDGSPLHFFTKTGKTALTVCFFQGAVHLSKYIHPLPVGEADTTVPYKWNPLESGRYVPPTTKPPYYGSREGMDALLNGPTYYVLAILAFDYIYTILWIIVILTRGRSISFINTVQRYKIAKYALFLTAEIYIIMFSRVVARYPLNLVVARWMYAMNSAELHFPLLYVGAYIAGINFVWYFKFLRATGPKTKFMGLSAGIVLFIRLLVSVFGLHMIYRNYPRTIPPFLDVRSKPALTLVPSGMRALPEEGIDLVYGVWVGYTLLCIPEALILAFWSIQTLGAPWGKFARHAHIQVYVQLIFVFGNKVTFFENIFMRWVFLASITIFCAHYLGVGGSMISGLMKRRWNALRGSRRTSADAEPEESVISL